MPPPRYLYTDSDLPITPPPALTSDDSDSWWAGVARCFVAIPTAGAFAALALSASLVWGYQQQTEEIVPQPAPQAVEEEYWQLRAAPYLPAVVPSPWWDDQLPAGSFLGQSDEDYWRVYAPAYPLVHLLYLPDPEELPAGSLLGVPEEEAWVHPIARRDRHFVQPFGPDEEIVPQPPVGFVPDEDYGPRVVFVHGTQLLPLWISDGAASAPAPAFAPDEESWRVYTPPYSPVRLLYLPDPEEIPAGSLSGVPEEESWQPPPPQAAGLGARLWAVDDEIVPVVGFAPDEDYWPGNWSWSPAPVPQPVRADDDIVPQPAPQVAEEAYWAPIPPSPLASLVPSPWWDDPIPAGALFGVPEEPAAGFPLVARWDQRIGGLLGADDEITLAAPAEPVPDEDYWSAPHPRLFYARPPLMQWADDGDQLIGVTAVRIRITTEALSLLPRRAADSLLPARSASSLLPARAIELV